MIKVFFSFVFMIGILGILVEDTMCLEKVVTNHMSKNGERVLKAKCNNEKGWNRCVVFKELSSGLIEEVDLECKFTDYPLGECRSIWINQ